MDQQLKVKRPTTPDQIKDEFVAMYRNRLVARMPEPPFGRAEYERAKEQALHDTRAKLPHVAHFLDAYTRWCSSRRAQGLLLCEPPDSLTSVAMGYRLSMSTGRAVIDVLAEAGIRRGSRGKGNPTVWERSAATPHPQPTPPPVPPLPSSPRPKPPHPQPPAPPPNASGKNGVGIVPFEGSGVNLYRQMIVRGGGVGFVLPPDKTLEVLFGNWTWSHCRYLLKKEGYAFELLAGKGTGWLVVRVPEPNVMTTLVASLNDEQRRLLLEALGG